MPEMTDNPPRFTVAEIPNVILYGFKPGTPNSAGQVLVSDILASVAAAAGGGSSLAQAESWTPNFSAAADALIYADVAMTVAQQATSGTGAVAYSKSTAASPSTFSATTLPTSLEAGAWLKITASGVTAPYAVHVKRTA